MWTGAELLVLLLPRVLQAARHGCLPCAAHAVGGTRMGLWAKHLTRHLDVNSQLYYSAATEVDVSVWCPGCCGCPARSSWPARAPTTACGYGQSRHEHPCAASKATKRSSQVSHQTHKWPDRVATSLHLDSKPSLITLIVHHPCCASEHTLPRLLNFYLWQRDDQSACFRASHCLCGILPPDICLAPGHEDERVVTASSDHTVRVWNMSTRTCDRVLSDAHSIKLVRCLIGYFTH